MEKIIGKDNLNLLITKELFLVRHHELEFPHQFIRNKDSKIFYASEDSNGPVDYDCFEEFSNIELKTKAFQNFYKLKEAYVKEYLKSHQ